MEGQKESENMVSEIGDNIFKGKQDVALWMEEKLQDAHPFGVFVDCYVLFEMVLVGHSNVQAMKMEGNFKLKLEADKALVLKTFKNKLLMLLGEPAGDAWTIKTVETTKISWTPGLPDSEHWETKNCLGKRNLCYKSRLDQSSGK
eukprot:1140200-Ditylum_brightwellii.AAC.1